jgi:hypothetical protein
LRFRVRKIMSLRPVWAFLNKRKPTKIQHVEEIQPQFEKLSLLKKPRIRDDFELQKVE